MFLYENKEYLEDIGLVNRTDLPWDILANKKLVVSGATGLLGSFLIDTLMTRNLQGLNCTIYALCRSKEKAMARFDRWTDSGNLVFLERDVNDPIDGQGLDEIDFVMHLASNTHPIQYATDPIGTITANIIGLKNMLDFAVEHKTKRFLFASSCEIYGENRGDTELFDESYCGYIDPNTLRAGYPESKRCGEALCQAYQSQKGIEVVIPRFSRTYGPTMKLTDSKAISQFIKKGVARQNIVLKSAGMQNYSYTYVADAVYGLLTVMLRGETGKAYNIADNGSNITLKDLANLIADYAGTNVIFEIPDSTEMKGYSKATKSLLSGERLREIGWEPFYDIKDGIRRTMHILDNDAVNSRLSGTSE